MSWKKYQRHLERRKRSKRQKIFGLFAVVVFLGFFTVRNTTGLSLFQPDSIAPVSEATNEEPIKEDANAQLAEKVWTKLDSLNHKTSKFEGPLFIGHQPLTIDVSLQRMLKGMFRRYNPLYAAAVVLDAEDGSILALVSHAEKSKPPRNDLAVSAVFPAASVFKLVTATAGIEGGGVLPSSRLRTSGNPYRLYPAKFRESVLRRGGRISLQNALAKSDNVAFADLTKRFLNEKVLRETARGFGFDREIPFDLPVEQSQAVLPSDDYGLAWSSTGLGEMTLSPLHAGLIAAAIINDGQGQVPKIFKYADEVSEPFIHLSSGTSQGLSLMMKRTITHGTARKAFRGWSRDPILKQALIGGKTGSLNSKDLGGLCDWFVGFAKKDDQRLAVAVVLVNGPLWHIKSTYVGRKIFENQLEDFGVLEARL